MKPSDAEEPAVPQINLIVDETHPPVGRVGVARGGYVEFIGWLGLVKALSMLFGDADDDAGPVSS